jgi:hypothetical protein
MKRFSSVRRNTVNGRGGISHPPQFVPTFVVHKKLRFQAVAASTSALQFTSLGDLWCMAATATSAYQIASHVRLRKIEIWGPMASSLVPVTVSIDWTGSASLGGFGKSNRVSDTSIGASQSAHLVAIPPPNSQIAMWAAASSTNVICTLTYPLGAIIDLTYDLVVRDDGSAASVASAVVGAAAGAVYVRSLDSALAGANLPPTSLATI